MIPQLRRPTTALFLLVTTLAPSAAQAGNLTPPAGPITPTAKPLAEIEPRVAITTANTPGDADSVFRITQPGSYYLAASVAGVVGKSGVEIAASDVMLDLNGFALIGLAGTLDGVVVSTPGSQNVAIRNGAIRAWGGDGVDTVNADNVILEQLLLAANTADGIHAEGNNVIVRNCVARSNGANGINLLQPGAAAEFGAARAAASDDGKSDPKPNPRTPAPQAPGAPRGVNGSDGSLVIGCTAQSNSISGIVVGFGCTVADCVSRSNLGVGIGAWSDSTIERCTAVGNIDSGIDVISSCRIAGCTCNSNGLGISAELGQSTITDCYLSANTSDGIRTSGDCLITRNTCLVNGNSGSGAGIHTSAGGSRIADNFVEHNDRGLDIDNADNQISGNAVRLNTDNYDIVAGNQLNILLGQLPESIDWPSTVTLAGNLTGSTGNGITVNADEVTIDLAGHSLVGVAGSLDGINVAANKGKNLSVLNGTIRGWGGDGLDAAASFNAHVRGVRASDNGGDGLKTGTSADITDCQSRDNTGTGINAGVGSHIGGCTARLNGVTGIIGSSACTITACASSNNTASGISAFGSSTVSNCTAASNGGDGIVVTNSSMIRGCTASTNTANGINAGSDCRIVDNNTAGNGNGAGDGAGINVTGSNTRIEGNNATNNDRGIDCNPATGNLIIRNSASGNAPNYDIVAGNTAGRLVTNANIATSSNPHANYDF